jgi:hypothetical protein
VKEPHYPVAGLALGKHVSGKREERYGWYGWRGNYAVGLNGYGGRGNAVLEKQNKRQPTEHREYGHSNEGGKNQHNEQRQEQGVHIRVEQKARERRKRHASQGNGLVPQSLWIDQRETEGHDSEGKRHDRFYYPEGQPVGYGEPSLPLHHDQMEGGPEEPGAYRG